MMRRLLPLLAILVLGACRLGLPDLAPGSETRPPADAAIEVTPLHAPAAAATAPPARPEAPPVAKPAAALDVKSAERIACEKRGGSYITVKSLFTCVRKPPDAGRRCERGTDCKGQCLARSMTCAPVDPLVGCNDVLDDMGRKVRLCLD